MGLFSNIWDTFTGKGRTPVVVDGPPGGGSGLDASAPTVPALPAGGDGVSSMEVTASAVQASSRDTNTMPQGKNIPLSQAVARGGTTGRPVWSNWSTAKAIREGLKANIWVYICAMKVARSVASVPLVVKRRQADGTLTETSPTEPLQVLLDNPNPYWSRQDYMERLALQMLLGGNSLTRKVRSKVLEPGRVLQLWLTPPDLIKPVPGSNKFLSHYVFKPPRGKKEVIPPHDIMHLMFTDPGNPYWGLSPVQAGAKTIDTDNEAVRWNKMALQNRAVTDGVFSFDKDLNQTSWLEARRQIREQHMGSKNARMPWVLGSKASWTQMSLSPVDMDFLDGRKFTRTEICAIFNVPTQIVGIPDSATYANYTAALQAFWRDTVLPFLADILGGMNRSIAPEFGDDLVIEADLSGVLALQVIPESSLNAVETLFDRGVPMSVLNKRLHLGLEAYPGWDVSYINGMPASEGQLDPMSEPKRAPVTTTKEQESMSEDIIVFQQCLDMLDEYGVHLDAA